MTYNNPDFVCPDDIRRAMRRMMDACSRFDNLTCRMSSPYIIQHACGTIACHAGLYALASRLDNGRNLHWRPDDNPSSSKDCLILQKGKHLPQSVGYTDGALRLADDLGFPSEALLKSWANANPEIWGNENGLHMFVCASAFGQPKIMDDVPIQTIINHWLAVADRIEALPPA